ncbi:MAG TPA: hypothetical protein VK716_16500 [Terracidiphilus sp.]|nr:hypothetical protein [Terracidiphilus sp.]
MIEAIMTGSWSTLFSHMPHANLFMLVAFPLVAVGSLRILLKSKAAARAREPRQWVLLREQDAEGIPLLAEGCSVRRQQTVKVRTVNPNYRRSDY